MHDKKKLGVFLTPELHLKLKHVAADEGVSMSEYVEKLVARELGRKKAA